LTIGIGTGNVTTNTAIGVNALLSNNTGAENTAVGYNSLYSNTGSTWNTGVGYNSLYSNTTGTWNTSVGRNSLFNNILGSENTSVGATSLRDNTANYNTAVGRAALYQNTSGTSNTSIGHFSGSNNKTGSNNTFLGSYTDCPNTDKSYSTAIGANAKITDSNQIVLGGLNDTADYPNVSIPGTLTVTSGRTTLGGVLEVNGNMFVKPADPDVKDSSFKIELTGANCLIYKGTSTQTIIQNNSGSALQLMTGDTGNENYVYINGTTKCVGINKTNPQQMLDVDGTLGVSGNTTLGGSLTVTGILTVDNTIGTGTATVQITKDDMTLSGVYPPPSNNSVVTREYVNNISLGYQIKEACQCATTAPITLVDLQTIDTSYTTFNGDRVLVKNQSTATENGIYIASAGIWLRSPDLAANTFATNVIVYVQNGDVNAKSTFLQNTNPATIEVNVDDLTFALFNQIDFSLGANLNLSPTKVLSVDTALTGINSIEFTSDPSNLQTIPFIPLTTAAGTYTNSTVNVDSNGRITSVATGSGSGSNYWTQSGTSIYYNSGNVGIGTSAPSKKLQVVGDDALINGLTIGIGTGNVINNTVFGYRPLYANTIGAYNIAIGYESINKNIRGTGNVGIGTCALYNIENYDYNTAVGYFAGTTNKGEYNTFIGSYTDSNSSTFNYSTALGANALITQSDQIVLGGLNGSPAVYPNVSIPGNMVMPTSGKYIQFPNGTQQTSAYTGAAAGSYTNTNLTIDTNGAITSISSGSNYWTQSGTSIYYNSGNVGIGTSAPTKKLQVVGGDALINGLTIGTGTWTGTSPNNSNTAIGFSTLGVNTSGASNVGLGTYTLTSNTTGADNVAIGYQSMDTNIIGSYNVAIGKRSLYTTKGNNNTALGFQAGTANNTGTNNTFIGFQAGNTTTSGTNNTFIGCLTDCSGNDLNNLTNSTAIGNGALVSESNAIVLGNTSITKLRCNVGLSNLSDTRDKNNFIPLDAGLNFINVLNPIRFDWNQRGGGLEGRKDVGFTAQELLIAQEKTKIQIPNLVDESNPDKYYVIYTQLIPVLVKAIQEMSSTITRLEAEINKLKK
jgi:hypothetical protein